MNRIGWNRTALGVFLLPLIALAPGFAQADPSDPFDVANKAPVLNTKTLQILKVFHFDVKVTPEKAKRGEVVRVTVTGTPLSDYHTYPLTKRTNEQAEPDHEILYSGIEGIKPLWPIFETEPELTLAVDKKIVYEHEKAFTWSQDLLIEPQAKPGKYDLTVRLTNLQICNKHGCLPPGEYRPLYASLEIEDAPAATPGKEIAERLKGPPPATVTTLSKDDIARLRPTGNVPGAKDVPAGIVPAVAPGDANNLWSFLLFASISAFLMLLTPCVFPMIPITVNFFIKQSEKEHHNPLLMASVYSGTIIVLLTVIMLAFGSIIIDIANNEWFNLGLGLVLIIFALSLFGMYEIELPHFLARYTSAREGQGGFLGPVFMAMTFTITSFTCTGPFLGLMLGGVAGVQPPKINLFLGSLVYSATFAAPFFVLALFPSVLKKLPKSGSWLNSVKVTMGFLEIGAALKFLSNADLEFFPGNPQVFNYDTVLASWIVLSISCGVYLLGWFRLPHDDKVESIGVVRMMIAVGFLGLAVYLAPAMFGIKPAGVIGDNAIAFLPPRFGNEGGIGGPKQDGAGKGAPGHKEWYMEYEDAWKDAVKNDKLIFIDFTGQKCVNCRYNESSVFTLPEVREQMDKYVKVALFTDSVPNTKLSRTQAKEQGARNFKWQEFLAKNDLTLPYYVILRPARDAPFKDEIPNGTVIGWAKGTIKAGERFDVPAFVGVLRDAQAKVAAAQNPADNLHALKK